MINEAIKPTVFDPGNLHPVTTSSDESSTGTWTLANGTPASCVQLGLKHFTEATVQVGLVISGLSYGKNTTAVFALSSGTIGAAMESALCGMRAVALSFASEENGVHDVAGIAEACEHAIRVVGYLYKNWDTEVHLYRVSVPLQRSAGKRKVFWTEIQQHSWGRSTAFREVNDSTGPLFQWAPTMKDIGTGIKRSTAPQDSWAIMNGFTSVAPLRANFMHVTRAGELEI